MIIALIAASVALLVGLWAVQLRTRDAATIDVAWAVLVAGGATAAATLSDGDPWRRLLVASMASIWAIRLAAFLLVRMAHARGEDGRYLTLRAQWGAAAPRNFLLLYLAQLVVAAAFVVPLSAAMRGGTLDRWAVAGICVWLMAVGGELLADRQLSDFRANPAHSGHVCREGLWRWSRHPNYFFEWLHWWAYVAVGHAAPLTLVGPGVMLLFLFRVTGIPHTERQALRTRGDAYRAYQRDTSIFVPWRPRGAA